MLLSTAAHLPLLPKRVDAFPAPQNPHRRHNNSSGTVLAAAALSSEEVRSRLLDRLAKLREKDRRGPAVPPEELKIVFQDDFLIVVDKPAGVLCVPSETGVNSIAQTVFEYCQQQHQKKIDKLQSSSDDDDDDDDDRVTSLNQMVVHRLGFDTSGLMVFAKTLAAVRGMHSLFRTRNITRQYEVLVAGHVAERQGLVNLPLMRDYEHPPYMRISTEEHQRNLMDLDPAIVGKKLLEAPKASLTHYQVLQREHWRDDESLPVTRLTLTSMTGRTHQLNCHCAAIGRPIVGDAVYGYHGSAARNGGLDESELPTGAAPPELRRRLAEEAGTAGAGMCVHAKLIRFRHPVTGRDVEFTSAPSF